MAEFGQTNVNDSCVYPDMFKPSLEVNVLPKLPVPEQVIAPSTDKLDVNVDVVFFTRICHP